MTFSHTSVHYLLLCLFSIPDIQKKYLARLFWFPTRYSWRRERDSNPWTANAVNGFRDRPVRPLRHLSIFNIYYNSFRFAKIHFIFHIQKFIFVFFFYYGLKNCFSVQFLNIFFLLLFHFSSFFGSQKHYSIKNLTQKKAEKIVVFSTFSHMLFPM